MAMKDLQPHQQRVIDERAELVARRGRLAEFFKMSTYDALPAKERDLLAQQSRIMDEYIRLLDLRIALF